VALQLLFAWSYIFVGDRGAVDREKRGREVYGRREKRGREAGNIEKMQRGGNSKLRMDHRNRIKVPDPVVKDLTWKKLRTKYDKKAMLIQRYENCIFTNISKGTAFLLQGLTEKERKKERKKERLCLLKYW